jgi:hypothetical protein
MLAKISQSYYANSSRKNDLSYNIGDKVMLSTLNRRRDYKRKGRKRAAKFMPRFDGPYVVIDTHLEASTITLDMPNAPNLFPTFHTSHVKPWNPNDDIKFPSRTIENPGPIEVDGVEEFFVDSIVDHRKIGRGYQYLVHFKGCGQEDDRWIAGREMEENEALDIYWKKNPQEFPTPETEDNLQPLLITLPHFSGTS